MGILQILMRESFRIRLLRRDDRHIYSWKAADEPTASRLRGSLRCIHELVTSTMRISRLGPDFLLSSGPSGDWDRIYDLVHRLEFEYIARLLSTYRLDCTIDVGANDGLFGLSLRKHGYEGRILSFEPAPRSYSRLEKAAARDKRWQTFRYALGDRPESATLNVTRAAGFNSLLPLNTFARSLFPAGTDVLGQIAVETRRLDSLLSDLCQNMSSEGVFMKIDTQGYDLKVLVGAGHFLDTVSVVEVELSTTPLYDGAPSCEAITEYLRESGFAKIAAFPATWDSREVCAIEYNAFFSRMT